ncbi:enoyl-CoA hydratase/isomerase family protein [Spongiibacter taiwanensis]|uniref:enoyl-CoA hydratase/isomerase family protein n=1 Tax=Spongiibacter taiwanensis TaxID=1748242 RepID=UPI002034C2C7|nr:enoyl-CoA hydratase/isomerase family protein [Spongiibacter taiwanensis]USA42604.1 enoyl-CoA hydratase/isomerase family protein [Spongiibacter taiwanensis]
MTTSAIIQITEDGAVATIELCRPEKRNPLEPDMILAMDGALEQLSRRDDISVIIVTGRSQSFCAGLDIKHLATLDQDGRVSYMHSAFDLFRRLHSVRQVTIAAVNGPAVAGGFDLAAFCDLRTSVPEAVFGQPEIRIGVSQFIYPLYSLVGMGRAKELALTGSTISADEAYRIGLVNHLFAAPQLMAGTLALAQKIASNPRDAILDSKATANAVVGLNIEAAFSVMLAALTRTIASDSHANALEDYLASHLAAPSAKR